MEKQLEWMVCLVRILNMQKMQILLFICFSCMFKHRYLPIDMLNSVLVPLVKNKNGDLFDRNNYRPIALSSTVSKVIENIIINRLEKYLWTPDN